MIENEENEQKWASDWLKTGNHSKRREVKLNKSYSHKIIFCFYRQQQLELGQSSWFRLV